MRFSKKNTKNYPIASTKSPATNCPKVPNIPTIANSAIITTAKNIVVMKNINAAKKAKNMNVNHHSGHHHSGHHSGHEEHEEGSAERRAHMIEFLQKFQKLYAAKLAKACENNAVNEGKVKQCLLTTGQEAEKKVDAFCTEKKTCYEQFVAVKPCNRKNIEETAEHVKRTVFKCAKEEGLGGKHPDFKKLSNGITECATVDFDKLEEHHKRHGGPAGKPHREGSGEHHSGHHHSGHGSGHPHFPMHFEHHSGHHSGEHHSGEHHSGEHHSGHHGEEHHGEEHHGEEHHGEEHHEKKREDPIEKICKLVEEHKKA